MARNHEERTLLGRKRREQAARKGQGSLQKAGRGFDPFVALSAAEVDRLPELLPLKYSRMKASPFAFFRGSVAIMAADLAELPHSGIPVQLCGDAHVQNLGSFAAPDGRLIFDFNDFDESLPGPWEWDVKRLATSIILAGQEAKHSLAESAEAALAFTSRYCESIRLFSLQPVLIAARHQIRRELHVKPVSAALKQSERFTPQDLLKKFTVVSGPGQQRTFRDLKPSFWRVTGEESRLVLASLSTYRDTLRPESVHLFDLYEPLDTGFKVVGTGSVGLRDYVVLLEGNGPSDPLFLQIKQETNSAYHGYLKATGEHNGQRVAYGQRAIQPLSDPLLGWTTIAGRSYLVRQLNDHKGSIDMESLQGEGLLSLAGVAGELLARGHARSGDACMIAGYIGSSDKIPHAIRDFAAAYAERTNSDFKLFFDAVETGSISASPTPKVQTSPTGKQRGRKVARAS